MKGKWFFNILKMKVFWWVCISRIRELKF